MSTAASDIAPKTQAVRGARMALGLFFGGLLGGVIFLAIAHQGLQRGFTELRFARSLGVLRGFSGADIPRQGLWTALLIGLLLAVLLLLPGQFLIRRWWLRALPLAAVTYAAWALIYAPRGTFASEIESAEGGLERVRVDVGTLGMDAGGGTPLVFLIAALGGAVVAARVSDLMAGDGFWQPKDNDIRKGLDELAELGLSEREDPSLELAEQGSPEPGETRGGDS